REGGNEQRAYSRVRSHHSVTIGWSMERPVGPTLVFLRHTTCRAFILLALRDSYSLSLSLSLSLM
ncbi:hypothetical protein WH47_11341, partial [Habropoda laboriosa]